MNDITALQAALFETINALKDKLNPMEIERAKAICEVSQVIVNAAKAEIDFARVNGAVDSRFFHKPVPGVPLLGQPEATAEAAETPGNTTVTQLNGHRVIEHKLGR